MDYLVNEKMIPADAVKIIKRYAAKGKIVIRFSGEVSMPAGENTHYPYYTSLEVTRRVAFRVLGQMQEFHERKIAANETPPMAALRITDASTGSRGKTFLAWIG